MASDQQLPAVESVDFWASNRAHDNGMQAGDNAGVCQFKVAVTLP